MAQLENRACAQSTRTTKIWALGNFSYFAAAVQPLKVYTELRRFAMQLCTVRKLKI